MQPLWSGCRGRGKTRLVYDSEDRWRQVDTRDAHALLRSPNRERDVLLRCTCLWCHLKKPHLPLLTQKDNSTAVDVEPNQTSCILLPENPSTGYQWMIDFPTGLLVQDQGYIENETTTPMAGSRYHYWDITAIGSGNQKINGIYVQPWSSFRTGNEVQDAVTIIIKTRT